VLGERGEEALPERHLYLGPRLQRARIEEAQLGVVAGVDQERQRIAGLRHRDGVDGGESRARLHVPRFLLAGFGVERQQPGLLAASIGRDVDRLAVRREPRVVDGDLSALRIERARRARTEIEANQVILRVAREALEEPELAV